MKLNKQPWVENETHILNSSLFNPLWFCIGTLILIYGAQILALNPDSWGGVFISFTGFFMIFSHSVWLYIKIDYWRRLAKK